MDFESPIIEMRQNENKDNNSILKSSLTGPELRLSSILGQEWGPYPKPKLRKPQASKKGINEKRNCTRKAKAEMKSSGKICKKGGVTW